MTRKQRRATASIEILSNHPVQHLVQHMWWQLFAVHRTGADAELMRNLPIYMKPIETHWNCKHLMADRRSCPNPWQNAQSTSILGPSIWLADSKRKAESVDVMYSQASQWLSVRAGTSVDQSWAAPGGMQSQWQCDSCSKACREGSHEPSGAWMIFKCFVQQCDHPKFGSLCVCSFLYLFFNCAFEGMICGHT